jgi:large subunit ribosomal protein L28
MSKRCDLTGTGVIYGNNVSHSNRKTRRRFAPNLRKISLLSQALGRVFSLRITAATLRSVDHNGGLDPFLLTASDAGLTEEAIKMKRKIKKANTLKAEGAEAAPKKAKKTAVKSPLATAKAKAKSGEKPAKAAKPVKAKPVKKAPKAKAEAAPKKTAAKKAPAKKAPAKKAAPKKKAE